MHILVVNDDGPPSPHSSPYVHSLVRALQAAGHVVSVCLPHTQRSWIGKAHMIGQTVKPTYYRPPGPDLPAAGLVPAGTDQSSGNHEHGEGGQSHGTTHTRPSTKPGTEEWILVDGTPASCVQIGLYHFFQDRGPIDLVVSGPNYGRNTTAVFALSSGTLGGALEAAVCKRRAIALSYAFFTRNHDTAIIKKASRQSVRVIEALWKNWPNDGSVDLYSVNIPLLEGLEEGKVLYTGMLQNYWGEGSCFTEVEGSVDGEVEDEERIREGEGREGINQENQNGDGKLGKPHAHKHFKWSPRFTDVYKSVDEAPPGNDGWAVKEGHTSITPLKANFWHPIKELHGKELQLQSTSHPSPEEHPSRSAAHSTSQTQSTTAEPESTTEGQKMTLPIRTKDTAAAVSNGAADSSAPTENEPKVYALVDYGDDYVQPLILSALRKLFPPNTFEFLTAPANAAKDEPISLSKLLSENNITNQTREEKAKIIQITPYEAIDFDHACDPSTPPNSMLVNSYMIRKALIRKHYLTSTVENWVAKNPASILKTHVKRSESFEVDYAEFLDDALVEAFDLRASLDKNTEILSDGKEGNELELEWWILKPGMSDRGQGIRIFATMEQLQGIFDEWEGDLSDSDDEEQESDGDEEEEETSAVRTSHLRHFVAQPYIHPPLLLPEMDKRKFHIRTYVLCVGALKVYVYGDMLALFAGKPYEAPTLALSGEEEERVDNVDLEAHLTNTCLQHGQGEVNDSVHRFWDVPGLDRNKAESIFEQICQVTGEVFEAAARGMMVHFQPMENGFEVFGLDFLVDAEGRPWLLEVNAFPDFKQTGGLKSVVGGFWEEVVRLAVGGFVGRSEEEGAGETTKEEKHDMVLVRDLDLGRRW
ncbi:tubulin-tyrosine ligase [Rhypophila sp. PSN 637]